MHTVVHALHVHIEQTNKVFFICRFYCTYMCYARVVHKDVNYRYGFSDTSHICLLPYIAFIKEGPSSRTIDLFDNPHRILINIQNMYHASLFAKEQGDGFTDTTSST